MIIYFYLLYFISLSLSMYSLKSLFGTRIKFVCMYVIYLISSPDRTSFLAFLFAQLLFIVSDNSSGHQQLFTTPASALHDF